MSHRYRLAFRDTLCGKKRSLHNGFARDQSSFRETTVGNVNSYESSHLVSNFFYLFFFLQYLLYIQFKTNSKSCKIFIFMTF